jgi:Ala-tRNA(Pro) deacylase
MSSRDPSLTGDREPAKPEDLFRRLQELAIETETMEHPPVYTVEEAKRLRGEIAGCHTKNLFLRNKKGAMWLLVCLEDRQVDLKSLGREVGGGRFSLGSAERLMRYLGVVPGAVSPLAVINDRRGEVVVLLDRDVLRCDSLNFHPLDNAMTTSILPEDFLRFLEAEDHPPTFVDFGNSEGPST